MVRKIVPWALAKLKKRHPLVPIPAMDNRFEIAAEQVKKHIDGGIEAILYQLPTLKIGTETAMTANEFRSIIDRKVKPEFNKFVEKRIAALRKANQGRELTPKELTIATTETERAFHQIINSVVNTYHGPNDNIKKIALYEFNERLRRWFEQRK